MCAYNFLSPGPRRSHGKRLFMSVLLFVLMASPGVENSSRKIPVTSIFNTRSGRVGGGMAVGTEVADTDLPTQFLFKSVCGFWRESYGHTEAGVPVQGPH